MENNVKENILLILFSTLFLVFLISVYYYAFTALYDYEQKSNSQEINKVVLNDYSQAIYSLSNDYRNENGMSSLKLDSKLTQAAQRKADDLCNNNYFSHELSNGQGFETFVKETGYEYELLGENLGRKFNSPDRLMNAWKGSELHNKNLLENFNQTGIGYSECSGLNIVAVNFAK